MNSLFSRQVPLYGGGFTERTDPVRDNRNVFFVPELKTDGLKFCLDLAAYSGCTVRAAYTPQEEEGGRESLDSPVGDWEFEVWDFHPDGVIKFLGTCPYRGRMINSIDMDQLRGA